MSLHIGRRRFALTMLGGVGVLALAACEPQRTKTPVAVVRKATGAVTVPVSAPATTADTQHNMTSAKPAAKATAVPAQSVRQKADEMDAHHEKRVKAFPAKTTGQGNQPLAPKMDGDVKVFELTTSKVKWEIEPGKFVDAWVYNQQLPGPEIRVTEGDKVRVVLRNDLEESTSIHFHGLRTPAAMDGVPFITQPPVKPGETFTYEFVAKPVGSHMYHSHHDAAKQVSLGLLGAFIVDPKDPSTRPAFDKEYTMILNDGPHSFTINGKSFPATEPLTAKLGQRVLVRYMNEGMMIHPMHLHGMPQEVIAKDGYLLPQPYLLDTLNVSPGDRWDIIITADEPGVWAFHCHVLTHAETSEGMFGMVTALIVEP
jgi:manganese oxidase